MKISNFLSLAVILFLTSCLNRQFVEGKAELVSAADSVLNDSALIYGYIYRVDWVGTYNYSENEFEVWFDNSNEKSTNDLNGYYSLKTTPGIHTIRCQETNNEWEKLVVEMKGINLVKNQKTHIDFYIGYTIE